MARKVRIQYAGAMYHVMNRGDRREAIFEDDQDRQRLLFEERMEWRRGEDLRKEFKRVERGWCLGGEDFRQELLEQVEAQPGPSHFGEAVQEAELAWAERSVAEGLARMGWGEADLQGRRKGEPRKVELAWALRSQTTMPLARI